MEYYEAVNYLCTLRHSRPKLGTETTAEMLAALDDPHDGVDFIQIAGSNGKGSTATILEQILREAGLDVGLYTSPDLNSLRERIRVNGQKIPKRRLTDSVDRIRPHVADLAAMDDSPTHFEVLTALALEHFGERDVDVAVLEVGIGGRYDATTVVDPVASAVTSVSLEHTDILGDTVEEIARDKAQVAPDRQPLVTGATGDALQAIRDETTVVTVGPDEADVRVRSDGLAFRTAEAVIIDGPEWHVETQLPLLGEYQATNAGIAATLARQVADLDERTIANALPRTHWPGRFEVVEAEPCVVLDGAHNPGACSKLATLVERYDYERLRLVFGALRDKDHDEMLARLPDSDAVTLCRPDVDRAENLDALERIVSAASDAPIDVVPNVLDAVERTIDRADPDDLVLVTGSLYTVSEARDRWTRVQIPKQTHTGTDAQAVLGNSQIPNERTTEVLDDVTGRTIKTYCRPDRAERIRDLMLSAGGVAAVSAIDGHHQHLDVVLNGSRGEFLRLIEVLEREEGELAHIASQLQSVLDPSDDVDGAFPWEASPAIMSILNVTPDSFHDGGEYNRLDEAVTRAEEMMEHGADVVDVGGESTRPGADPVSVEEEIERVVPVVERLTERSIPVSVDTRKAAVAEAAIDAGAAVINDVTGLDDVRMRRVVAEHDVPVVAMHSLDAPVDPDRTIEYDDVVEDVVEDLTERLLLAERAGIDREKVVLDPGIGFGKTAAQSFELIERLDELRALGCPILVGHSHKSMFDHVGRGPSERLVPTATTSALAVERGVDVVRVHDVAENLAAIRTGRAILNTE